MSFSCPELQPHLPADWPFAFKLQTPHVWDGFVLLSLLEDREKGDSGPLVVPHAGDQSDRFKLVMQERNQRIRLFGQPEVPHKCDKCTRYFDKRGEGGGIGMS